MARQKPRKKDELIQTIIDRRNDILENKDVASGLIDAIVPLSAMDGKLKSINDDGTVTVEFSAPIIGYLECLTRAELLALLDALDETNQEGI